MFPIAAIEVVVLENIGIGATQQHSSSPRFVGLASSYESEKSIEGAPYGGVLIHYSTVHALWQQQRNVRKGDTGVMNQRQSLTFYFK